MVKDSLHSWSHHFVNESLSACREALLWGTSGELFLVTEIAVFSYASPISLGVGIAKDLKHSSCVFGVATTTPCA